MIPDWVQHNAEWAAAIHLLQTRALREKKVMRFVDFEARTIDFPEMFDVSRPWSHGERIMVTLAWALFNGGQDSDSLLVQAIDTLDGPNMLATVQAIVRCRPDVAAQLREWLMTDGWEGWGRAGA